MEHARAQGRQVEHLVVGDLVQLAGLRHYPRVCRVHAVHVCVNLTLVRVEGRRQGYRRGVGAAASQGRVVVVFIHSLETGDDDDAPVLQLVHDAVRVDALQAGVSMHPGGVHRYLEGVQGHGRDIHRVEGHGHQRHRYLLACGEQHIQLPLGRIRIDLLRLRDQFICGFSHCGKDDNHIVALFEILRAPSGHIENALLVSHGGSAKLFHYQHRFVLLIFSIT